MILVLVNIAVGEKKLTDRCGLDLTSSGFCLCCWTEVDSASSVHCKCHDVGPPEHLGPVITHFTLTLHTHTHIYTAQSASGRGVFFQFPLVFMCLR